MKQVIRLIIILILFPCSLFGQKTDLIESDKGDSLIRSNPQPAIQTDKYAQYKINKTKYDYRSYNYEKDDPYNPKLNGVLSFVVPGSGHILVGEYGRGFAFLGAAAGCASLFPIGFNIATNNYDVGRIIALTGLAGLLAIDIWSSIDATRMVKVNNLAWRDKTYTGYNIRLEPFLMPVQKDALTGLQTGLSFRVNF